MKIIKIKSNGYGQPCEAIEVEAPISFDDDSEPYEYILITTKTMAQVMLDNDCWFDCHGNLCSKHGHLAPSHFPDLGRTFHVTRGSGWDIGSDWLRTT